MNHNNLFASAALFGELYNNDKDVYDVIGEFIIAALEIDKKWIFTSNEVTDMLNKSFDFSIPESVVKSSIRSKLVKKGIATNERGQYFVDLSKIETDNKIISEFELNKNIHSDIINQLIEYIEGLDDIKLDANEQSIIYNNFNSFLMGNGVSDKYAKYISSFVITKKINSEFTKMLNIIKEGLILYNGIRYTANLNDLGNWNTDLTIFLDTEHLFNAAGFNGMVYQTIFDDFLKLTKEINYNNINRNGKKKIHLKYFEETNDKVIAFFYAAEQIVKNKSAIDPSKEAMNHIINGCTSPSDIITKKAAYYSLLTTMGISADQRTDYYKYTQHILDDQNMIDNLSKNSSDGGRFFDEDECRYILKTFTKINVLRQGISNRGFENSSYILLTGKTSAHIYANSPHIKLQEKDIPFATDIDFIINRFWFKLKKGFNNKDVLPKSFDVITKAQIILSSQINKSITTQYNDLVRKHRAGTMTTQDIIDLNYSFRDKPHNPEDFTPDNINESLIFLDSNAYENYNNEKALLLRKVSDGEKAMSTLRMIRAREWVNAKKPLKSRANIRYSALLSMCILIGVILIYSTIYTLYNIVINLTNIKDSLIDIIGLITLIVLDIIPLFKLGQIKNLLRESTYKYYLSLLKNKASFITTNSNSFST
jgi:hypothetical protein